MWTFFIHYVSHFVPCGSMPWAPCRFLGLRIFGWLTSAPGGSPAAFSPPGPGNPLVDTAAAPQCLLTPRWTPDVADPLPPRAFPAPRHQYRIQQLTVFNTLLVILGLGTELFLHSSLTGVFPSGTASIQVFRVGWSAQLQYAVKWVYLFWPGLAQSHLLRGLPRPHPHTLTVSQWSTGAYPNVHGVKTYTVHPQQVTSPSQNTPTDTQIIHFNTHT